MESTRVVLADLPPVPVLERVMPPAQVGEIVDRRFATLGSIVRVIEITALCPTTASGEAAAFVADCEHATHCLARPVTIDCERLAGDRVGQDPFEAWPLGRKLLRE